MAEALADAGRREAQHACVTVEHRDGWLVVTVESDRSGDARVMTAVADRVGALGGVATTGPNLCRVEIPCG